MGELGGIGGRRTLGYCWTLYSHDQTSVAGMGIAKDQDALGRQVGALLATLPRPECPSDPRDMYRLRVEAIR